MNILITICARGGSKGIPGKNIKLLNGKALIFYTLATAIKVKSHFQTVDIQLSTDSSEIAELVNSYGIFTSYRRPAILATDTASKIDVIRDAWYYAKSFNNTDYDFIVDLDVTSPLRSLTDICEALSQLQANSEALNIFSVSPAHRNPYFNMVESTPDGFVQLIKGSGVIKSRQEAPVVYDMNASFYIYTKNFMEEGFRSSITDRSLAYIIDHICFDLDNPIDFTLMDLLFQNDLLDFEL